jgi:isopentenyldiphosphate isomerase
MVLSADDMLKGTLAGAFMPFTLRLFGRNCIHIKRLLALAICLAAACTFLHIGIVKSGAAFKEEILDLYLLRAPRRVEGKQLHIGEMHKRGLPHSGIWIFAFDASLRIMLAQRALSLRTCPGAWLILGEHTKAGEVPWQAAARCLREEAPFIQNAELVPVGREFMFHFDYNDDGGRVDVQWTQIFVAFPRDPPAEFGVRSDLNSVISSPHQSMKAWFGKLVSESNENGAFRSVSVPDLVRLLRNNSTAFCNSEQRLWTIRALPLVVRILTERRRELFEKYLKSSWQDLVEEGHPVCCSQPADVPTEESDIALCGRPCLKAQVSPV